MSMLHHVNVQEVTVENFLNIIQGNKDAMVGIGSGKVIERWYMAVWS